MKLTAYGYITVASAAALSGLLWYERGNGVQLIDNATGLAAKEERARYAYQEGVDEEFTGRWVFPSNALVVTGMPVWHQFYADTMVMPRDMALYDTMQPAWLDATMPYPADGDVLATCTGGVWLATTTNTTVPGITIYGTELAVSGAVDRAATTRSLWPTDGITNSLLLPTHTYWNLYQPHSMDVDVFPFPLTPTNAPFSHHFYSWIESPGLEFTWEHGNWWTRIGMGVDLFRYSCERLVLTHDDVLSTHTYGSGYSPALLTNEYTSVNYNMPQIVNVEETSGTGANGACVYYATSLDRETAVYGVADAYSQLQTGIRGPTYHVYGATSSFGSPHTAFAVVDGEVSIELYLDAVVGNEKSVTFTYFGDVSGPASCSWNELVAPYQGVVTFACAEGKGGVVLLSSNVGGYLTSTQFAIVNPDETTPDIIVTPATREAGASGSVSFSISLAASDATASIKTNKGVSKQNLDEMRIVLSSLSRTIYIAVPSDVDADTITSYDGSGEVYEFGAGKNVDTMAAAAIAAAAETGSTEQAGYGGLLVDMSLQAEATDTYGSADVMYSSYELLDCVLPYPSDLACASGMVSKVSVYAAVYDGEADDRMQLPVAPEDVTGYTGDGVQPDHNAAELLGLTGLHVAAYPTASWPANSASAEYVMNNTTPGYPYSVSLSLLVEESNPVSRPVFDLGLRTPTLPASGWHGYNLSTSEGDESSRVMEHSIRVAYFVVVVDWNWEFLSAE